MKFTLIAASLVALAAAHNTPAVQETCSVVTVTVTQYSSAPHVPSAPASIGVTDPAPYPTGPAAPPAGPTGGASTPLVPDGGLGDDPTSGVAKPTGTGSYSAPPAEFTGAASSMKVGGALAGVGAVAAFFL